MARVEIVAREGYKLTQVEEVPFGQRLYVSKVYTPTPNDWKEVPISEYHEWQTEIDKLNPVMNMNHE